MPVQRTAPQLQCALDAAPRPEYAAAVRHESRMAWLQLADYHTMRAAVDQRPRALREFQPGDSVCY